MTAQILLSPRVRPVDNRRDLLPVANLIELCFGSTMDQDGRDYIQQIRRAARDFRFLRWFPGPGEQVAYPLHGYVYEENQKVIANLSLIPTYYNNRWNYLIANVAVHPDYRRRGIGRQLTEIALDHVQTHGAHSAWLHVRQDNEPAIQLYQSLGLTERARRVTWQSKGKESVLPPDSHFEIRNRTKSEWDHQIQWLNLVYPPEVTWNLPLQLSRFEPGIWAGVKRFLNGELIRHWTLWSNGQVRGLITWEPTRLNSDTLWLAPHPDSGEPELHALLSAARQMLPFTRPLQVNYPAGRGENPFSSAGFQKVTTLIWMEKRFK